MHDKVVLKIFYFSYLWHKFNLACYICSRKSFLEQTERSLTKKIVPGPSPDRLGHGKVHDRLLHDVRFLNADFCRLRPSLVGASGHSWHAYSKP